MLRRIPEHYDRLRGPLHNFWPALLLTVASPMTMAAPVDGKPTWGMWRDTGLFVWRTSDGHWQMRVLAANGDQHATGEFETAERVRWSKVLLAESEDTLRESSGPGLEFDLLTARRTIDGLVFNAGPGDVCLRTTSSLPVYLGSNATPATAPVDLTGSGACSGPRPDSSALVVKRISKMDWEVRLSSDDSPASFDGSFEFTELPVSYQRVSFDGGDWLSQPDATTLNVHMEVWPGWYDGIDFTTLEFAGVCLRSTSGQEQVVSLLSKGRSTPVQATTPVDLTNNGSCGLPADPRTPPTYGRKFNPGHYVVLTLHDDDASLAESMVPGVKGFVKRYAWRELEPTEGNYDFSPIDHDLALASTYGVQLVAMIEDKSFSDQMPTPDYLRDKTLPNIPGGYSVVRWDAYVNSRYKALISALGQRFDANPHFEGIATTESAHGLDAQAMDATGYSPEKYRDVLIDQLSHAARSLPGSRVFWFMNFLWGGNWHMGEIAREVAPLGVVLGGPDVAPDSEPLQVHTYPFYDGAAGRMPIFAQVEPSNYHHPHADPHAPTKYWTPAELFDYGRGELHVNYMFWVRWRWRPFAESYNWWDAMPVIQENPSFNR